MKDNKRLIKYKHISKANAHQLYDDDEKKRENNCFSF